MGYVYMITNTVNQKKYIGISVNDPEKDRIKRHLSGSGNRIIASAVKKYGVDVFTYEILEANVFDEFLPELEVAYIANYNTVRPHGYNLTSGGERKKEVSSETCRKISDKNKGRVPWNKGKKRSPETCRKISETLKKQPSWHKGKKRTAETCLRISESKKGQIPWIKGKTHSNKTRQKLSEINKGKTIPAETREKMSKTHTGKKLSAKTREKMSEARKGKPIIANRRPDHHEARTFFFSLSPNMSTTEKRQLIRRKFPNIPKSTIRRWTTEWTSTL